MMLYKYNQKERTEPFREFTLRATQPNLMNDPWECLPSMTVPASWGLKPFTDDCNNLAAGKMLQDEWSKGIGILCLSESPFSTLMWSHYASDHQGYVLGFDCSHESFNPADMTHTGLGKMSCVKYLEKRFTLGERGYESDFDDISYLYQKGLDWEYEKEWRLIVPLESCKKSNDSVFVWAFKPEALRQIVIGFRASSDLRNELIAIQTRCPWVSIGYARPSAITYQMVIEPTPLSSTLMKAT